MRRMIIFVILLVELLAAKNYLVEVKDDDVTDHSSEESVEDGETTTEAIEEIESGNDYGIREENIELVGQVMIPSSL